MTEAGLAAFAQRTTSRGSGGAHALQEAPPRYQEFEQGPRRRSHLYIDKAADVCSGTVWVGLRAERRGFLRGAAVAATLVAITLAVFAVDANAIVDFPSTAAAALLLPPGLLIAYAFRPGEHEMARSLYLGPRVLLAVSGFLAICAAVLLITLAPAAPSASETQELTAPTCLRIGWGILAVLATIAAGLLITSLARPPGATNNTPDPG